MIALGFRTKLLLAMMLLVAAVTVATLFLTEDLAARAYESTISDQSQQQFKSFSDLQEARLSRVEQKCLDLRNSVRLQAALEEASTDIIYDPNQGLNELKDVLRYASNEAASSNSPRAPLADFVCFLDAGGKILPPPAESGLLPGPARDQIGRSLAVLGVALTNSTADQRVFYMAAKAEGGRDQLHEVVFTPIVKPDPAQVIGALILGFPMKEERGPRPSGSAQIRSGIWLDGSIYFLEGAPDTVPGLADEVAAKAAQGSRGDSHFDRSIGGEPARVFLRRLNPGPGFQAAYQVMIYSLAKVAAEQAALRGKVLGLGAAALLAALAVSLALSHNFSAPVQALVRGTTEIQRGNFGVKVPVRGRDELGLLAASFNEMAGELALKEKYRSVLDMVADKQVAREIMSGRVALGGELREVSVLFCDIRGFTPLTQNMDPGEVIRLLNEHMTALSRVVYENEGVVDKYVGDLIMAVFGAPVRHERDAYDAARCALRMIEERRKANETSRYRIDVGIGVATGDAVAGCMGSNDRNNYTVLGERVNLASRLCGKAGKMEVFIDDTTRSLLGGLADAEAMPGLELKGFSGAITAHRLSRLRPFANTTAAGVGA